MTRGSLLEAVPSGSVFCFAVDNAPQGWLACDGSSYSTAKYATLFSVIGYTYGNSGTQFRVPDLRDMFVRNADNAQDIGRRQDDALKTHEHTTQDGNGDPQDFLLNWNNTGSFQGIQDNGSHLDTPNRSEVTLETDPSQVDQNVFDANETRPKNIAFKFIIKT